MKATGHKATGLAAGLVGCAFLLPVSPLPWLAVPAGFIGGNFPDRIEWLGSRRWVPHRTLTHWIVPWVALMVFACVHLDAIWASAVVGFAAGGIAHWFADLPNPMGAPLFLPGSKGRLSLKWWNSGEHDLVISVVALAIGAGLLWWKLRG